MSWGRSPSGEPGSCSRVRNKEGFGSAPPPPSPVPCLPFFCPPLRSPGPSSSFLPSPGSLTSFFFPFLSSLLPSKKMRATLFQDLESIGKKNFHRTRQNENSKIQEIANRLVSLPGFSQIWQHTQGSST